MKKLHKEILNKGEKKRSNRIILASILILLFLIALKIIKETQSFPDKKLQGDVERISFAIASNDLKILSLNQIDESAVEEAINQLKKSGDIFEPKRNFISKVG